jgi:putative ABC transport system permease protein
VNTLALAWRNLLRNRRRSLTTLLAMVLGVVAVLLFGGYVRDLNYGLQTEFVQSTGHLQIQRKDYYRLGTGNPAAYGMSRYEKVLEVVRSDAVLAPMLAVATPLLEFGGIAGNFASGLSRTVYVSGFVVEDQNRMRAWNAYEFPSQPDWASLTGTSADSVVIGTGVARVLQLCDELKVPDCPVEPAREKPSDQKLPDDIAGLAQSVAAPSVRPTGSGQPRIEVLATNTRGAPNVAAVRVLSAEYQGVKELDDVYVGMHLSQAQRLIFGASPPKATAIALQLHRTDMLPAAKSRLDELLATQLTEEPLEVLDYETLNPYYGQALAMFGVMFGFFAVLIGCIVLFTVANTMSTAVVERTVEIGTLRAIGLRQGGIRAMFLVEGAVLGCFGAALGVLTAMALATVINKIGFTWLPPGRVEPIPLAVRVMGEHLMLAASAVGFVLVAALSALLPASRAARMNIVEALRHA